MSPMLLARYLQRVLLQFGSVVRLALAAINVTLSAAGNSRLLG